MLLLQEPIRIFDLSMLYVDTDQAALTVLDVIHGFWASWSSLGITNGNRSHNKPLELI